MNVNSAPLVEDRSHFVSRGVRPRVSVVLLSSGSIDQLERALLAVSDGSFALNAQLIIVREDSHDGGREAAQRLANVNRCSLAFAERGSNRAALAERGLELATGDIVTIRYDADVGEGDWLAAFERVTSTDKLSSHTEERIVSTTISDERAVSSGRAAADRSRSSLSTRRSRETHSSSAS